MHESSRNLPQTLLTVILTTALCAAACSDPPDKRTPKGGPPGSPDAGMMQEDGSTTPDARDIEGLCGDGVLDEGEACDGDCPTSCDDLTNMCGTYELVGSAADCSAACEFRPVACGAADGCCPAGCDASNDPECSNECGNGVVEDPEICDGACPATCDDGNACTTDVMDGSPSTCDATCRNTSITACVDGDGCCPNGCDSSTDGDCSSSCGNGVVDPGELCDGDCPTSCDDGDECTTDTLTGSASACTASCNYATTSACIHGDGCCPAGCSSDTDDDCTTNPNDLLVCAALGATCGSIQGPTGTVNCGTCSGGQTCRNNTCSRDQWIGDECVSGDGCPRCLTEAKYGYDDGYCSKNCQSDSACAPDAKCVDYDNNGLGLCLASCSTNSDCRSGHYCQPGPGAGANTCVPGGSGNGAVGSSCSTYSQCAGGLDGSCALESNGWKGGYCIVWCDSDADCPSGSSCDDGRFCTDNCQSDADCRSGYLCFDGDQGGTKTCLPAGVGNGSVGDACAGAWECGGREWGGCVMNQPGGYCSVFCGSGQAACPSGSECIEGSAAGGGSLCWESCTVDADCRSGYVCDSYDFFGPTVCIASN